MIVKIPMTCSRTGKTLDTELPLEEAQNFTEAQAAKIEAGAAVESLVKNLDVKPDLVVYWKGQLHVLTTVLEPSHDAVSRLLNDVLKKDIYPTAEPRKRRTAEEIAAAGETPATEPKKRGRKAAEAPAAEA